MWMPVPNIAQYGVVEDIPAHLTPMGAWSSARNVRFRNGRIFKSRGTREVYSELFAGLRVPAWGMNVIRDGISYWLYSDEEKLRQIHETTSSSATRTDSSDNDVDYSTKLDTLWNGGLMGGYAVITNGADVPQSWEPGELAEDLENWPSANLKCGVLRPFGYFLVALNITDGSDNFPDRVRWSHSTTPGNLPSSWDIDDATRDAGQVDLQVQTPGHIVDAARLRDWLVVYRNNSTHAMRYIGGNNVFGFTELFGRLGALASGCVTPFSHRRGAFHCVFTGDDIIVHDGRQIIETLEGRVGRQIARNLSASYWERSFVVNMPGVHENWICYPETGSETPNLAVVWNYNEDTVSYREIPEGVNWITLGSVTASEGETWNTAVDSWDSEALSWDEAQNQQHNIRPVQFAGTGSFAGMAELDTTSAWSGTNFSTTLEREGIAVVPNRQTKEPIQDLTSRKLLRGARLQVVGGPITVQFGASQSVDQAPVYQEPGTVIQEGVNLRAGGVLSGVSFGMRILSEHGNPWEIQGLELDIEKKGTF